MYLKSQTILAIDSAIVIFMNTFVHFLISFRTTCRLHSFRNFVLDQREQNFNNVVQISAFRVEYVEISVNVKFQLTWNRIGVFIRVLRNNGIFYLTTTNAMRSQ